MGRRGDVQAIADKAVATFGGFDTWVNVAGLNVYGPLREISQDDHERLICTNFWGTVIRDRLPRDRSTVARKQAWFAHGGLG